MSRVDAESINVVSNGFGVNLTEPDFDFQQWRSISSAGNSPLSCIFRKLVCQPCPIA
jgi:hypothetical protein